MPEASPPQPPKAAPPTSSEPLVSVLLPARNAAKTLPIALRSVLKSRGVPFDIVAVDHASIDDTRRILARFASAAPVRIVDAPPSADLGGCIQIGLDACRAPFVARFDADDVMHPDRLRDDVAWLARNPATAAVSSRVKLIPRHEARGPLASYVAWQNAALSADDHAREIWIEQPLCHPATTFRRSVLVDVGGFRSGVPEDYELFLRLVVAGHALEKRPAVHHAWRRHAGQSTRHTRDTLASVKAHALVKKFALTKRDVVVAGAGKEGGRISRALALHGVRVRAFLDVAPWRIGRKRHGVDVVDARELRSMRGAFVVAAVGTSGSRGVVRAQLHDAGFVECVDCVVVA